MPLASTREPHGTMAVYRSANAICFSCTSAPCVLQLIRWLLQRPIVVGAHDSISQTQLFCETSLAGWEASLKQSRIIMILFT